MMIYRRTESERTSGTVNLRVWLRQYMRPAEVNAALVQINREPYVEHLFPATLNAHHVDLAVEITPRSGEFKLTRLWW